MDVPYYPKEDDSDFDCAIACLRMALAYYGCEKEMDELRALAGSLGHGHYTLPWGTCNAAQEAGLHVTFFSKQPRTLLPEGFDAIHEQAGVPVEAIHHQVEELLQACEDSANVRLLAWEDRCLDLPKRLVLERDENGRRTGIVIPTLWWGTLPHNVVLTGFEDGTVTYHDPNPSGGPGQTFETEKFFEKWIHPNTDNDLLIVSNERIDL